MKKIFIGLVVLGWLTNVAQAHEAHEHGTAKLNIAVDGAQVSLGLESPLANLLPFEHSPATPEQRAQVRDLARQMNQAEALFKLTPAAECRLTKAELASANLDPALLEPEIALAPAKASDDGNKNPEKTASEEGEEHGDLDADFAFLCAKPEKLNSVDVLLFEAWPKMEKIEARAVTPKGQSAATLSAKKHLFSW